MTLFYIFLIVICFSVEILECINTDNLLRKIGLGLIIVGSLLKIDAISNPTWHNNELIAFGALMYLMSHFVGHCKPQLKHIKDKLTNIYFDRRARKDD